MFINKSAEKIQSFSNTHGIFEIFRQLVRKKLFFVCDYLFWFKFEYYEHLRGSNFILVYIFENTLNYVFANSRIFQYYLMCNNTMDNARSMLGWS